MALLFQNKSKGFYIIEIIISSTIGLIVFTALASLIFYTIKTSRVNKSELKATMYLQEIIEVAKDLEQSEDWDTGQLTKSDSACLTNTCYLDVPQSLNLKTWVISTTPETLDGYVRSLTVEKVCRNGSNKIATCDGINPEDQKTKKVIATILWNDGFHDRELNLETYLYNYAK